MPSAGFEPATPAVKRLHTYAVDRKATGQITHTGMRSLNMYQLSCNMEEICMEKFVKYQCKFYDLDSMRKWLVVLYKRLEMFWPDECLCEISKEDSYTWRHIVRKFSHFADWFNRHFLGWCQKDIHIYNCRNGHSCSFHVYNKYTHIILSDKCC